VGAVCPGCLNQDPVHSDIWDFLIAPDGTAEWLSGDGGVYTRSLTPLTGWNSHISGLHTHHIHTLTTLQSGYNIRSRLAYPTSDNDAWFWDAATGWGHESSMGDVGWTAGDEANSSVALLVRRTGPGKYAMLTGFGANLPSGGPLQSIELNNDISRDGPQFFNFIQSLSNENPRPFTLDAVMLTNLPLQYADANSHLQNVPGPLGQAVPFGPQNPVILRNMQFVTNADIDVSKGQGWQPAANNLPAGVQGFWVSGGHAHPIFYVYAIQSGQPKLFKGSGLPPPNLTQWEELNVQGNVLQPKPFPPSEILAGGINGPAFVNPYNSYQIYVLTNTGVRVSTDGGFSFQQDAILTNLLTGGGKYPRVGAFADGNGVGVRIASRAVGAGTLADMGFYRNNPNVAVAASPFTGVLYKDSSGKWHDLSQFLPRPFTPVSAVRMDGDAIYVATEGRGVMRIPLWHWVDLSFAAKGTPANRVPDAAGNPFGYMFNAGETQHVVYRGTNNRLNELWWNSQEGWHWVDLSFVAKGAPANGVPDAASDLSGYAIDAQGTQHIFYRSGDNRLNELWWNSQEGWHWVDLSYVAQGAPNGVPNAAGNPFGYMFNAFGTQHVVYRGTNNRLNELYWDNQGWHWVDLSFVAQGAPNGVPDAASDLSGYTIDAQGTQHIFYRSGNNRLNELYWDNQGWHWVDLSYVAQGAPNGVPNAAGSPFGYMFNAFGTQHVVYRGTNNRLNELYWDKQGWHWVDLSYVAQGAPNGVPDAASDLSGCAIDAQGTQHIFYRSGNNRLNELYWDNQGWHWVDLSFIGGAPDAAGNPFGYVFNAQGTLHVVYRGTNNRLNELWWP